MTFALDDLKAAFEAGERYGADVTMSHEDGLPVRRPDFDKWYKQYAKTVCSPCRKAVTS